MAEHVHVEPVALDDTCDMCDWCPMCEVVTEWTDDEHCRSCGYEWGTV